MRAFSFPMCCVFAEGDFRAPVRRTKPASRVAFRDSARMHLRCGGEAGAAKGQNYGECGGCARTRGWWHCSSARAGYYLRRSVAVTYPRVVGLLPSPPCCLLLCIFFKLRSFHCSCLAEASHHGRVRSILAPPRVRPLSHAWRSFCFFSTAFPFALSLSLLCAHGVVARLWKSSHVFVTAREPIQQRAYRGSRFSRPPSPPSPRIGRSGVVRCRRLPATRSGLVVLRSRGMAALSPHSSLSFCLSFP